MRAASLALARGRVREAVQTYQGKGRIIGESLKESAVARLIADWNDDYDPAKTILILAHLRRDVRKLTDTWHNIADHLHADPRPAQLLFRALENLGIEKKLVPMRGGTDGAALSARGLPTPNFFTGACNFHSRFEFLPVPAFEKSYETALMLCNLAADEGSEHSVSKALTGEVHD